MFLTLGSSPSNSAAEITAMDDTDDTVGGAPIFLPIPHDPPPRGPINDAGEIGDDWYDRQPLFVDTAITPPDGKVPVRTPRRDRPMADDAMSTLGILGGGSGNGLAPAQGADWLWRQRDPQKVQTFYC